MDGAGSVINFYNIRHHVPNLFVLYLWEVRDWLPFFFLYEKVCDSAFDFTFNCAFVLLQKAGFEERELIFLISHRLHRFFCHECSNFHLNEKYWCSKYLNNRNNQSMVCFSTRVMFSAVHSTFFTNGCWRTGQSVIWQTGQEIGLQSSMWKLNSTVLLVFFAKRRITFSISLWASRRL